MCFRAIVCQMILALHMLMLFCIDFVPISAQIEEGCAKCGGTSLCQRPWHRKKFWRKVGNKKMFYRLNPNICPGIENKTSRSLYIKWCPSLLYYLWSVLQVQVQFWPNAEKNPNIVDAPQLQNFFNFRHGNVEEHAPLSSKKTKFKQTKVRSKKAKLKQNKNSGGIRKAV